MSLPAATESGSAFAAPPTGSPVQLRTAQVLRVEREGSYHRLSVHAPPIAAVAQPGQFVAFAVGGPESALLLRRAFSLYGVDARAGTVDVVLAVTGQGTAWLVGRRPGDHVDVVGPLGRPFPLPTEPLGGRALLVGGGYGAAPLLPLARQLRERGQRVDVVLGAGDVQRLVSVMDLKRLADASAVTTDDGSAGRRGRVTDVLGEYLPRAAAVYACGPMAMLRAVGELATRRELPAYLAVEEAMACGVGVCMTCVLPVHRDGQLRMVRACTEGPVFAGSDVAWDAQP